MGSLPVGWYFYTQGIAMPGNATKIVNEPCATQFKAIVSVNQMSSLDGMTVVGASQKSFPTIKFEDLGNDYTGTLKRGLPQGILYPVWFETVPMTSGTCVSCNGQQYSAAIMATRLHVP